LYGCPVFDNTNNVHSTIKFTHKTSRTNIWMLTLPVKMIFDIYNKPTDEHQYLSPPFLYIGWGLFCQYHLLC
jgi:hypothetical protein